MTRTHLHCRSFIASCLAGMLLLAPPGHAQDAAVVNAHTVKVVLDNAKVRVLEATLKPGDKENLHSHPAAVIYVVDGGKVRNHIGDKVTEADLVTGQTLYRDPVAHWAENIGTTTIHLILVELKEQP